jgi:hypothetical protein
MRGRRAIFVIITYEVQALSSVPIFGLDESILLSPW